MTRAPENLLTVRRLLLDHLDVDPDTSRHMSTPNVLNETLALGRATAAQIGVGHVDEAAIVAGWSPVWTRRAWPGGSPPRCPPTRPSRSPTSWPAPWPLDRPRVRQPATAVRNKCCATAVADVTLAA